MYQRVSEEIAVVGLYKHMEFIPKKFQWHNRIFPIDKITLTSEVKDGIITKRLYSVMANGTVYRIEFNRTTEQWQLLEVWVE